MRVLREQCIFAVVAVAIVLAVTSTADAVIISRIYWTDWTGFSIGSANLDGTGEEEILEPRYPYGIAVDGTGGKIYWTALGTNASKVQRANLDGTEVEDLVTTGLSQPSEIALDRVGGKMYWTDMQANKIQRANLDGSGVEDILASGLLGPRGIVVDGFADKMYWLNSGYGKIQRANLDGTGIEDLVIGTTGSEFPYSLDLDLLQSKMYWTDNGTDTIYRANLDGSSVEELIVGLENPQPIVVDPVGAKFYWGQVATHMIYGASLDGSGIENIIAVGAPTSLALWPIPEPSTLLLLGLGGLALLRRRRACIRVLPVSSQPPAAVGSHTTSDCDLRLIGQGTV